MYRSLAVSREWAGTNSSVFSLCLIAVSECDTSRLIVISLCDCCLSQFWLFIQVQSVISGNLCCDEYQTYVFVLIT